MQKVKGHGGLVKDPDTGGVINVDDNAYRQARLAKKRILEEKARRESVEDRLSNLEELVNSLINKRGE